jgi:hypothetical protein
MTILSQPRRLLVWLADFLFGFDFFISYAHWDGSNYPETLARVLEEDGYRVFLDRNDYKAGDDLRILTRRYVHNSNSLVLVTRPSARVRSTKVARVKRERACARQRPSGHEVKRSVERA